MPRSSAGRRSDKIDVFRLRPAEAAALLNSTPLETVIDDRTLRTWRQAAGARVTAHGSLTDIDLFRLTAWMVLQRRQQELAAKDPAAATMSHRERMNRRMREESASVRDIGPIPAPKDPAMKASCARDFRRFCECYLAGKFTLAWSPDHLKIMAKIQRAVLEGGLFAMAMPRGSGKSAMCEAGCIWAMLYGHHHFIVLIGEGQAAAVESFSKVKAELRYNDRLLEDFPEACFPIRALNDRHQLAPGQTSQGESTHIQWKEERIVLPTIASSACSGAIMKVAGMEGRVRGMSHTRPRKDGKPPETIRPSLVFVDDPQNDESAKSPSQCAAREAIVQGAILGLAGPNTRLAGLAAMTVIHRDDLAERMLNPEIHPQWQGERCKMVYSFPTEEELWEKYRKIRREAQDAGDDYIAISNEFYEENREKMDLGGHVAWEARKRPDEISALQHAMNLRIDRGERIFFAEYQNDPGAAEDAASAVLRPADIMKKERMFGLERCMAPKNSEHLTAFIDVQKSCLFYMVVAWYRDMTGCIIDYGTEPEQYMAYFTLAEVRNTLEQAAPGAGFQAALRAGLERLTRRLFSRPWPMWGGGMLPITKAMIDANWAESSEVVYQLCRQSPFSGIMLPSHGKGVTAADKPMAQWQRKPGDLTGLNWKIPANPGSREIRHVVYDTNWWKNLACERLRTPRNDRGSLYLFGLEHQTDRHRMLADHLTSEHPTVTTGRGRTVSQWTLRSPNLDNHWWDCLVGNAVCASMLGASPPGIEFARRTRVSFSEMANRARTKRQD